jgi:HEAT repeat protein
MSVMGGTVEGILNSLAYIAVVALLVFWWRGGFKSLRRNRPLRKRPVGAARDPAPEILAKIEKDHELSAIPAAFYLLLRDDPEMNLRAVRSITKRIGLGPITQLAKLDSMFRERTSMEWDHDWQRENPATLLLPSFSETEKTDILGLASFHPNGYYREKAIRALAHMTSGAELPYLIIRLNDWVTVIWDLSHRAVLDRLKPENARAIINSLPLIFRLRGLSRRHHHELVDASIAILSKPEVRPELDLGLRSQDGMIRRCCFQAIIEARIFDNADLLERLLQEPWPMNRSFVLRQICASLTPEEIRPYRSALLSDRSTPVRLIALRTLHRFNPVESIPDLERAVLDEDPSVREAARYLLGAFDKKRDFPALYREVLLGSSPCCPGAIAGLGETGQADDTKYVAPFLKAEKVRWARSGLRALARLDFAGSKNTLIACLADPRPGVVKEARRLLHGRIDAMDAELIHRDHFQKKPDALRRQAAFLFCSLGKWDALQYLLEICADQSEAIAEFGRSALSNWLSRYNRSAISPTPAQLDASMNALNKFGSVIPATARQLIEFSLNTFS